VAIPAESIHGAGYAGGLTITAGVQTVDEGTLEVDLADGVSVWMAEDNAKGPMGPMGPMGPIGPTRPFSFLILRTIRNEHNYKLVLCTQILFI